LFLSFVAVSKKSLLASAIDCTTPVLERTQAHRQQEIAPALKCIALLRSSALLEISRNRQEAAM
jgi:hypothetical protein